MVLLKALHLLGRSRLQVYRALCSHSGLVMEHLLGRLPRGRCDKFGILFPCSNFLQTRRSARSPTRRVMSFDVLARCVLNFFFVDMALHQDPRLSREVTPGSNTTSSDHRKEVTQANKDTQVAATQANTKHVPRKLLRLCT